MRQRHDEHDRAEVDRQDADRSSEHRLQEQRQQDGARAGGEHSQKDPARAEHRRHGQPEQHDRREAEVAEIVRQAAPHHLHDIGRAGDVNSKIPLIVLTHDFLEMRDERLGIRALREHDDVARFTILGNQQPGPKRAV